MANDVRKEAVKFGLTLALAKCTKGLDSLFCDLLKDQKEEAEQLAMKYVDKSPLPDHGKRLGEIKSAIGKREDIIDQQIRRLVKLWEALKEC